MSNSTSNNKLKIFIIVCVVVFLTGLAATLTGIALHGWRDLDRLPGSWHLGNWNIQEGSGNTDTYTLRGNSAEFTSMDLNLDLCDVEYVQGDKYRVKMTYDAEMTRPDISIEEGKLVVKTNDEHFISGDEDGFTMKLEITVPEGTTLSQADLTLDACQVALSDLDATILNVNMDIGELTAEMLSFDKANFDLNLCDANLQMVGEDADYHYDITNDLGSMTVDGQDVDAEIASARITVDYYNLVADLSDVEITYQWPSGN
jgi:hypothetical protein